MVRLSIVWKERIARSINLAILGHFPVSPDQQRFEVELELIQTQMTQKPMLRAEVYARALRAARTRTRTNTNPNDTEANAAGRSVRACVARKSKL